MQKLFCLLLLSIGPNVDLYGKKYLDFSISAGPAFFKFYNGYKLRQTGLFTELNTTIAITKRSSILSGVGMIYYNKSNTYSVDTATVQFEIRQSANGCNCRVFEDQQSLSVLYIPFRYKYSFINKKNHELYATTGFELFWLFKNEYSYGNYIRYSDGSLRSYYGSGELLSMNSDNSMFYALSIGIGYRVRIKEYLYANTSIILSKDNRYKNIRLGMGISYKRPKYRN